MRTILPALTAEVLTTQKCNLNCTYCFEKIKNFEDTDLNKTLELLTHKGLFYSLPTSRFYILGGEPLMNMPFLVELIETIKSSDKISSMEKEDYIKSITGNLTTNGVLIDKHLDTLKKYNFSLQISLDGPEDINDKCRVDFAGNGKFKKIEENLKLCREQGIRYTIHGALSVNNYSEYARICRWFLEQRLLTLPKNNIRISDILGTNFTQIVFEENINDSDIDIFLDQMKKTVEMILFDDILKDFNEDIRKQVAAAFLKRHTKTCSAGNTMFSYDNEFNVYTCHRTNTGEHLDTRRFMSLTDESVPIDYKLYEQFQDVSMNKTMRGPYYNLYLGNKPKEGYTTYQTSWCPATNLEYSDNISYMPSKYNVLLAELQKFIPKLAEYYGISLSEKEKDLK